ncbi:hypothetical protein CTEN210_18468 [Chaetoceros tenuissimus]|uniref:Helicase-associated domain-containing protein n=1 Tax=Chaetoceros tenuissimus TaxID=426638 RepID=A0AAD3DCH8_9STRA|nr:hypothetical protein CTEN210_18468 [Chaetoceros tenuissimus]
MNYAWKTVYGDQRLYDLARQLRGESTDSEEEEVNAEDDDYSDDNDSDDYEFVNEEDEDDDDEEEKEDALSSEEEDEVKDYKYSEIWQERYKQLKEYKAENGHCNVPQRYEPNKALGTWVRRQRQEYRKMSEGAHSSMTDEQVEKLESIGFVWVLRSKDTWNERYEQLKEFKTEHGHCNVPQHYESNKALGKWVSAQRQEYNLMSKGLKSSMTDERVAKLESLGFLWVILSKDTWNKRLEELKEFKTKHEHCIVPRHYGPNKALGVWVQAQRTRYRLMKEGSKCCGMTEERVKKLQSIGFLWNPMDIFWNERFQELREFKAQHGHCNVPKKYDSNKALGMWVKTQRAQFRLMKEGLKSSMTDERVEKLEHIGFVWNRSKDTWKEKYEELEEYYAQHGHCNVPKRYKQNKVLGSWVHTQRKRYRLMKEGSRSGCMTEERVKKLENIGFEWTLFKDVQKYTWDERLGQLKRFKAQYGHCNVPYGFEANKALSGWVQTQRTEYKRMLEGSKSALTEERVEKLVAIGFTFRLKIVDKNVQKYTWDERLGQLKEFKAQYGHCNVPAIYESNKSLGKWVQHQRQNYKIMLEGSKSSMTEEKVNKLENIALNGV